MTGSQLCGDGAERDARVFEHLSRYVLRHEFVYAFSIEQSGPGEDEIEVGKDTLPVEPTHKCFQRIQIAHRINGAHERTNTGSGNKVDGYPLGLECPDYADMRVSARRSASQCQPDLLSPASRRHTILVVCCPTQIPITSPQTDTVQYAPPYPSALTARITA